jgi:protein TonB
MSTTRVLLELQVPSPRMPDARLASLRGVGFTAITDMFAFARPGRRVLLELDATSPRMPDMRLSPLVLVRRPGELPGRLASAVADMSAMAVTSGTRVLLALDRPSPRMPEQGLCWPGRLGLAAAVNVTAVAMLVLLASGAALRRHDAESSRASGSPHMVFIVPPQGAAAGGGGGGGNRRTGPIPRATAAPHQQTPVADDTPPPIETRAVVSNATAVAGLPTLEAVPASAVLGAGDAGGVGTGGGNGAGPGTGPGQGPGQGGGEGDGVYRLGGGVIAPILISEVRPNYTPRALAQRLQGSVLLEVIIRRDGLPDAIRILQSLDPFGLDEEAIRAVRQWRFRPGRIGITPVDVLVTCIVDFHLR